MKDVTILTFGVYKMKNTTNEITITINLKEDDLGSTLKHVEALIIGEVFERTFNKSTTAKLLDLSRGKVQKVLDTAFNGKYRKINRKK